MPTTYISPYQRSEKGPVLISTGSRLIVIYCNSAGIGPPILAWWAALADRRQSSRAMRAATEHTTPCAGLAPSLDGSSDKRRKTWHTRDRAIGDVTSRQRRGLDRTGGY